MKSSLINRYRHRIVSILLLTAELGAALGSCQNSEGILRSPQVPVSVSGGVNRAESRRRSPLPFSSLRTETRTRACGRAAARRCELLLASALFSTTFRSLSAERKPFAAADRWAGARRRVV